MNYRCHQITTASEIFLHKSGAVRSVDWIFIIRGAGLAVSGGICDNGQKVLQSYFQTGNSSGPSYFQIFFLIAFLEEPFIRNIIIILCINYHTIIICNNNNNAVINNNHGRLQGLILFFKIATGTRKNFFEIYRQFGHPPAKRIVSPAIEEV